MTEQVPGPPTTAGWYVVPGEVRSQRFWDGTAWTDLRAPAPAALPPIVWWAAAVVIVWGVLGVLLAALTLDGF